MLLLWFLIIVLILIVYWKLVDILGVLRWIKRIFMM